jgi:hypothetical protein
VKTASGTKPKVPANGAAKSAAAAGSISGLPVDSAHSSGHGNEHEQEREHVEQEHEHVEQEHEHVEQEHEHVEQEHEHVEHADEAEHADDHHEGDHHDEEHQEEDHDAEHIDDVDQEEQANDSPAESEEAVLHEDAAPAVADEVVVATGADATEKANLHHREQHAESAVHTNIDIEHAKVTPPKPVGADLEDLVSMLEGTSIRRSGAEAEGAGEIPDEY